MSFTTAGAVLRLPQTYTLTSSLTLDASGLSRPVTILPAWGGNRHFILSSSAVSALTRIVVRTPCLTKTMLG